MKLNLKILNLIAVGLLSFISFSSCKDDDWEPLKWKVENLSPENIVVKTHPGNKSSESEKFIIANEEGGEIIFYCENYDELYIAANEYGNNDDSVDREELSVNLEGNKLVINFPKFDELPEETSWLILLIKTRTNKNPGTVFWIGRNSDLNFLD